MNGEVTLINTGTSLSLTDPVGGAVTLSGTTTTGLQELANAVAASGFPGRAIGSGVRSDGACPAPFVLESRLTVPAMLGTQIDIGGTIIIEDFPHEYVSGIEFDTLSRGKFHHHGIINILGGDSYGAITFKPVTNHPTSSFFDDPSWPRKEIYGSSIRLGNINVIDGDFNSILKFAAGAAGFNNNVCIEWNEILCRGNAQYGGYIDMPDTRNYAYACFVQNILRGGLIDGATVSQFCEGGVPIEDTDFNCLGTNIYDFAGVTFDQATNHGVTLSGVMNIARFPSISKNAGSCAHGIVFVENAQRNYVINPQNDAANKVNDSSGHTGADANVVVP